MAKKTTRPHWGARAKAKSPKAPGAPGKAVSKGREQRQVATRRSSAVNTKIGMKTAVGKIKTKSKTAASKTLKGKLTTQAAKALTRAAASKASAKTKLAPKPLANARSAKPATGKVTAPPKVAKAAKGAKGNSHTATTQSAMPSSLIQGRAVKKRSNRIRICKADNCNSESTTSGFCRLHYLQHWRALKSEESAREETKLNRYVERMMDEPAERGKKKRAREDDPFTDDDFEEYAETVSQEETIERLLGGIKIEF